jgi:ATP-dependent DNA helicase RecG
METNRIEYKQQFTDDLEKGCYIRTGTSAEPMTAKQIEYLFSKRVRNSLGRIQSPRQDLTFGQLKIYYEAVGKTLNSQFIKNLELLTDEGKFNYVAYLMADVNGMSMKVAKYNGKDRAHLAENYEYGYCSLVKATKQILDKVELENKIFAQITPKERTETQLWDMIALREAIINAIVHNDYTREVPPKVEFFNDRIEITSYGGLPDGLSEEDFFEGVSMPRNKEIMRIFKDLELVEQLGSGVPRILQSYGRDCFCFLDNFIRMTLPALEQVTEQVKRLVQKLGKDVKTTSNLMQDLELKHRPTFLYDYLKPALEQGFVEMTIPDKPNSKLQKYRLTTLGKQLKEKL